MEAIDHVFATLKDIDKEMTSVPAMGRIAPYNSITRQQQFDHVYQRQQYVDKVFCNKNTIEDPITGSILHHSSQMAKNKYGLKSANHTWNVDHIVPLKTIHSFSKDNPFLTNENIRAAANKPLGTNLNYRVTQSSFNKSKQDRWNHDMALEAGRNGNIKQAGCLLADEFMAMSAVNLDLSIHTIKNMGEMCVKSLYVAGKRVSTETIHTVSSPAVEVYLALEVVRQMYLVSRGEVSVSEATRNVGRMTVYMGRNELLRQSIQYGLCRVEHGVGQGVLKNAIKDHGSAYGAIGTLLVISLFNVMASEDEISMQRVWTDLFENTVGSVTSLMQTMALFLPVPGMGGAISLSLLAMSACSAIYQMASASEQHMEEKLGRAARIEQQALREIKYQRDLLQSLVSEKYQQWDSTLSTGFHLVFEGSMQNDVDIVSHGLDQILGLLNKRVRFQTEEEFEHFFMDGKAQFTF